MNYLLDLTKKVNYFHKNKEINLKSLQRQLRPFCNTQILPTSKVLFVKLKDSKQGVSISLKHNKYVDVVYDRDIFTFSFYCETNFDLVSKLLKHNLLN